MDEQIKTVPALEAKYPDLVNQIRTEAVNSERERIKSIMDTAPAGYESIVEDALFKTPVDAGQVALKIVAEQKKAGAKYLAAVAKDAEASAWTGSSRAERRWAAGTMARAYLTAPLKKFCKKGGNRNGESDRAAGVHAEKVLRRGISGCDRNGHGWGSYCPA